MLLFTPFEYHFKVGEWDSEPKSSYLKTFRYFPFSSILPYRTISSPYSNCSCELGTISDDLLLNWSITQKGHFWGNWAQNGIFLFVQNQIFKTNFFVQIRRPWIQTDQPINQPSQSLICRSFDLLPALLALPDPFITSSLAFRLTNVLKTSHYSVDCCTRSSFSCSVRNPSLPKHSNW